MTDVVAAVIIQHGRFLVCKRPDAKRHGGLFEFPGGKVHRGESAEDALRRELREELAVELVHSGEELLAVHDEESPFVVHFVGATITGTPALIEHTEIVWATPAELSGMPLAPADRVFVEKVILRSAI
jgi:8-oxo-dGTP diphosphatase